MVKSTVADAVKIKKLTKRAVKAYVVANDADY